MGEILTFLELLVVAFAINCELMCVLSSLVCTGTLRYYIYYVHCVLVVLED